MTDSQLLSVLIGNETISNELLKVFSNDLAEMATNLFLANIKGLGPAKLTLLNCAFELGKRKAMQDDIKRHNAHTISSSDAVFAQFNQELSNLDHEEIWALYLSRSGKVLKKVRISSGGVDFAGADIRMIVKPAVNLNACNVAMAHNHPHSGLRPSSPDRDLTMRVKDALALFDIKLLDHIIISDGKYYSFADNGEL